MKATLIPHFSQITDEAYYKSPLLSNSECSKLYAELQGVPGMKAKAATLRTGQLLHLAIYQEPDFIATPEFRDTALGLDGASPVTINLVQRMARAAKDKCPVLRSFLNNKTVRFEEPIAVYFANLGCYVKVKPDASTRNRAGKIVYLHDAKSTATTSLAAFLETFKTYGYWRQAVLYMAATGAKNMFFTGISKSEPHQVWTVSAKEHKAELAAAKAELLDIIDAFLQFNKTHQAKCQGYLSSIQLN